MQLDWVLLTQGLSQSSLQGVSWNCGLHSASVQTHSSGCWEDFEFCWLLYWGLGCLLGVGQMPPLIPCHVKLSCGIFLCGSWFPSEQTRENREEGKTERLSLCNPISGVTWPWTLFHVLFIRCKSLGLAYTQQEGITEGHKYLKSRVVAVCHGWANRSMELVNNLPKVTQIVRGRARIKI